MDRYSRTGVLAAGLISGVSIYIFIPYLRSSFRRFSDWAMTFKSIQHSKTSSEISKIRPADINLSEEHISLPRGSSYCQDGQLSFCPEEQTTFKSSNAERESFSIEYDKIHLNACEQNKHKSEPNSKELSDLPETVKQLITKLETFNILTETVEFKSKEDRDLSDKTMYCKNLFLKDRKGKFYYVIVHEDSTVNLRQLKYKLHAHRNFSFASTDEVVDQLHAQPGCITPFAFMDGSVSKNITVAISRELMFEKKLNFHPSHPDYATRISFGLLLKLFGHLKRKLQILDI